MPSQRCRSGTKKGRSHMLDYNKRFDLRAETEVSTKTEARSHKNEKFCYNFIPGFQNVCSRTSCTRTEKFSMVTNLIAKKSE